jgi:carbohydrate diacid regulator
MLSVSHDFAQIADAVANKIAELLYAPVVVIDSRGCIITCNDLHQSAFAAGYHASETALRNFLRIPLQHEAEMGEIIVGESANQEPISPRLAQALVELVINQTALHNQSPPPLNQHELKNQLIYDLLHNQIDNDTVILERAKYLGIDLNPPRAVILIDAADYILDSATSLPHELSELEHQRRAQTVIRSIVSFFHLPSDTICADLKQGKIAVLKASDSKNLDLWTGHNDISGGMSSSWANLAALKRAADALLLRLHNDTGRSINIGIGRYHPGIRGLAQSYEDARAALSLGCRFHGVDRVHCLGELGIAAFVGVADESTKVDLARYLLSPLDHEPELLITLDRFFAENCCPSSTAKQLSIHRNTLSYRLDKITSLTGLDPRKFDDAMQMRLSLLLRSLYSSKKY